MVFKKSIESTLSDQIFDEPEQSRSVPSTEDIREIAKAAANTLSGDVRQQWEGIVTSVDHNEFVVTLRNITNPNGDECEAVLPIQVLPLEDFHLLLPGAILYWSIGYAAIDGCRRRISSIRLRP